MKSFIIKSKKLCLLVLIAILAVATMFFALKFTTKDVSAASDLDGFKMLEGAQVRLSSSDEADDTGIRFRAQVDTNAWKYITALSKDVVVFGMEIYPKDNPSAVKDFATIADTADKMSEFTQHVKLDNNGMYYYDASITYNRAQLKEELTNSKAHNPNYVDGATEQVAISDELLDSYLNKAYATELTARAYFKVDGVKTYVSNPQTRSIWGVAADAYVKDPSVMIGEEFLLAKYFKDIVEVDSPLSIDQNGEILEQGVAFEGIEDTDKLFLSSTPLSMKNGYVTGKVLMGLNEETIYNMYKITDDGVLYVYNLNYVFAPFIDREIGDNVLADFNEAGYFSSVTNISTDSSCGSHALILEEDLEAEGVDAETGVLKLNAKSYFKVKVDLQKTFKLVDIEKIYMKASYSKIASGSEFRILLFDKDGNEVGKLLDTPIPVPNQNTLIFKNSSEFISRGYNSNTEIYAIELYCIAGVAYFDEIGFIEDMYIDADIDENVVADFNEEEYIFNVESFSSSSTPGAATILLGENATAVGANSGVVAVESLSNWNNFDIKVQKPFKLGEIDSIVLKIKYSNYQNLRFALLDANDVDLRPFVNGSPTLSFSEGGSVPKISTILSDAGAMAASFLKDYQALTDKEWATVVIPSYVLTRVYETDREVAKIRFYNNVGTTQSIYIDEIKAMKLVSGEANPLAAEDFNGFDSIGKSYVIASDEQYNVEYLIGSLAASHNATSGIISYYGEGYFNIHMPVAPTYTLDETGGLYITIKHSNATQNIGQMRLYLYDEAGNAIMTGKYFSEVDAKYTNDMTTDWVTVEFTAEKLASLGAITNKKIGKFVINSVSAGTICVDEIGYLAKAQ